MPPSISPYIIASGKLMAKMVVGHPSMHATRRVTTGGYPYIREFKCVGADPCVCPEMHPSMHVSKRVTTGGYPYTRSIKGNLKHRGTTGEG